MTPTHHPHSPTRPVLLLAACIALLFALAACAAGPAPDAGTLQDGVYHNPYFGFDLPIPQTWTVVTGEAAAQALALGREQVRSGGDASERGALEKSINRTSALFVAFDNPADPHVAIFATAENIVNFSQIKSGEDYLKAALPSIAKGVEAQETGAVYPMFLGGKEAAGAYMVIAERFGADRRSLIAIIIRRHALCFVISAWDQNGLAEGGHLVREISFGPNPGPAPLSNGQIQGITGGVLVALGVLGRVVWSALKRRRERRLAALWGTEAGPSTWPRSGSSSGANIGSDSNRQ